MSLMPLSEALKQITENVYRQSQIVVRPLAECINCIGAETIVSTVNIPRFDHSAMDGYAIKFADFVANRPLVIVGKALAGNPFLGELKNGECVRIMTGAMIPRGADTVIMQEESYIDDKSRVSFNAPVKKGQNIRFIGEDVAVGETLLEQGTQLNTGSLTLLASLGITQLAVFSPVKVAIFSTGDELVDVGKPLQTGKIYDSNRFMLKLLLSKLPCAIIDHGIIPDEPALIEQTVSQASKSADMIISSGGVSVGEADFTGEVLAKLGTINFWHLAIKPGKPVAFGKIDQSYFFGLPGNPVSSLVTFYQLVYPALMKLAGLSSTEFIKSHPNLTACTTSFLKKSVGRQDFQRGFYWRDDEGKLMVKSVGIQGSHILSAFNESNCFIVLEQNRGNVEIGEMVQIQPFNFLLK